MIVEVRGTPVWTRVRLPPGPLLRAGDEPVFFLYATAVIKLVFLLLYLIFSYKTDILLRVPVEPDLIYMLNSILSHFVL